MDKNWKFKIGSENPEYNPSKPRTITYREVLDIDTSEIVHSLLCEISKLKRRYVDLIYSDTNELDEKVIDKMSEVEGRIIRIFSRVNEAQNNSQGSIKTKLQTISEEIERKVMDENRRDHSYIVKLPKP